MDGKRLSELVAAAWQRFVEGLVERLPALGLALAILAASFIIAKLAAIVARWVVRLAVRVTPEGRVRRALEDLVRQQRAAEVVGRLAFWLTMCVGFMEAAAALGLSAVGTFVGEVALYLPRLFVAVFIAAAGVVAGRLAGGGLEQAAHSAGLSYGAGLGRLLRIAIMLAAIVVAIDQLGLQTAFLTSGLLIVVAALLGSAALAFGIGARTTVANILASHYVQKLYEVGQQIRVGESEGRIVRIAPTAVIVDTGHERVVIPAEILVTTRTVVLPREA
jgi:hypothetical protein